MIDLLLTNVRLADDQDLVHVGISGGVISAVGEERPQDDARQVIDCEGDVALPGLIESHIHLDKAILNELLVEHPASLADAISSTRRFKASFTREDVYRRSRRIVEMAVRNGTTFLRTHPDIDPVVGLTSVEALLELQSDLADCVDIQVVAFPQEGILSAEGTERLMRRALELGAGVVGGCPYSERDVDDARKHVDIVFDLAEEYGLPVDIHADFSDDVSDPRFTLAEYIAEVTIRRRYQGRVALGHMTSLAATPPQVRERIIERLREAAITVVPLPATDMHLAGRSDRVNIRRGLTPIAELVEAGVNVCFSSNNVRNAFTPYGRADLLEMGLFLAQTCHLSSKADMCRILEMTTHAAARNVGIADRYGIEPGRQADLVVIGTKSVSDVLLDHPADRLVIKSGRIVARTVTRSEVELPSTR
ncbi:amidohydrolase family protein [Streptomyces sp. NPDC004227]